MGIVTSFQNILDNVFLPLFEVTVNPDSHPQLHVFLKQVRYIILEHLSCIEALYLCVTLCYIWLLFLTNWESNLYIELEMRHCWRENSLGHYLFFKNQLHWRNVDKFSCSMCCRFFNWLKLWGLRGYFEITKSAKPKYYFLAIHLSLL